MGKILNLKIYNYFNKEVSPYGISLVRISLGLSILSEYFLLITQRHWIDEFFNIFLISIGFIFTLLFLIGFKTKVFLS